MKIFSIFIIFIIFIVSGLLFSVNAQDPVPGSLPLDTNKCTEFIVSSPTPESGGLFGRSACMKDDLFVVGEYRSKSNDGVLYFYKFVDNEWVLANSIQGPTNGGLGISCAIGEDKTVISGAYIANSDAGLAYIYQEIGGVFTEVVLLDPPDLSISAGFGIDVALSGDLALVGAWKQSAGGAAYLFSRNEGGENNWGQIKKFTGENDLGRSVSISGNFIAIGDSGDDVVKIFSKNEGGENNWGLLQTLSLEETSDDYGNSVSLDGNRLLVGSPSYSSSNPSYAFLYEFNGNIWEFTKTFRDGSTSNRYGFDVSIKGDYLISGAYYEGGQTGAAYLYEKDEGGKNNWGLSNTQIPQQLGGEYGVSVDIYIPDKKSIWWIIGSFKENNQQGVVHLYNCKTRRFTLGSWIVPAIIGGGVLSTAAAFFIIRRKNPELLSRFKNVNTTGPTKLHFTNEKEMTMKDQIQVEPKMHYTLDGEKGITGRITVEPKTHFGAEIEKDYA